MAVKKGGNSKTGGASSIIKKEHKEHLIVIVLTVGIVLLFVFIGYSMYTYYKTKAETTTQIFSLNGTINSLSEEKAQLITDKNNLILERDTLNQTVKSLNLQKSGLTAEKNELTSNLVALQARYDNTSTRLAQTQADLANCSASL